MQTGNKLHAAVSSVAPIVGVSIGKRNDKSTWRIDFTEEATPEQRSAALAVVAGFDPDAPTQEEYSNAIQALVDNTARARQYTDGVSLASYAASTNAAWAAEAAAFVLWRDTVWAYAYAELAKVIAGLRPQPTVSDLLAELPSIVWPSPE